MPDWLSDPSPTAYLLLATVAAGAAVYWYRTQTRRSGLIAAGVLAVVGLLVGVAWVTESPREEAIRRVEEMIAAANEFRPDGVMPNISDRFKYRGETKASFGKAQVWDQARHHAVRLAVWDFDRTYVERPQPDQLAIGFLLKVEGQHSGGPFQAALFVRAVFAHDPDGAWRLLTFTIYEDPLQKAKGHEFVVPFTS